LAVNAWLLLHASIFVLDLLFVLSTFIVDFSMDTCCCTLYAMNHVHAHNFGALFTECKNAFVVAEVPRMRTWTYGNDKRSWRVDRVLACHVRVGLYKWIASPGLYLTGIRNINGQMRFCRRERMAHGCVSIYPRRTILSRRTHRRYTVKPLRRKHFDYYHFFLWKMFPQLRVHCSDTVPLENKLMWLISSKNNLSSRESARFVQRRINDLWFDFRLSENFFLSKKQKNLF